MDFHQFSFKKAPALPATPHPAMGDYSSPSASPAAVASDSGDTEKARVGGERSLASQAGGVWVSGAVLRSGPGTLPAWHSGQELALVTLRG